EQKAAVVRELVLRIGFLHETVPISAATGELELRHRLARCDLDDGAIAVLDAENERLAVAGKEYRRAAAESEHEPPRIDLELEPASFLACARVPEAQARFAAEGYQQAAVAGIADEANRILMAKTRRAEPGHGSGR